jgi:hypothetical protein
MENISSNHQAPLARQGDIAVRELPDEVLVYDLKSHKAHCLNKTAAFIWQHCDGQTTVVQMAKLLEQDAGSPVDEEVIWYALDKLDKAELLDGKLKLPVKDGISRRRMIRRLGAMVAVPTVLSLVAPTAFAGASVIVLTYKIPTGQCTTQANPVNCDDRCCTGNNPDDPGDRKQCIGSGPSWSCTGPACVSTGPASQCTPSAG